MKTPTYYLSRLREECQHTRDEFDHGRSWQRIHLAVMRGAAASSLRKLDPHDPSSWEFSGFSQNGEDGIIDYLLSKLLRSNRYFIEIGASDGLENNTSWLAIVRRYSGLMIDGNSVLSGRCREHFTSLNWGLQIVNARITRENVSHVMDLSLHNNPDLLSLDIDGIDYYVTKEMLELGMRPKIIVVEYNSAFGPTACATVKYKKDFDITKEHPKRLYYGVSISGWRRLFSQHQYHFVTVDQNGVNAFFLDSTEFPADFVNSLRAIEFRENFAQMCEHRTTWQGQYELIKDCGFVSIG
jgi:hypothetical protein